MNLPSVFQNKKIHTPNNSQELFYGSESKINIPKIDINKKIKTIFSSPNYIYKMNVIIQTRNKTYETTIIGKSKNYLITINNELINIKDIIDINEQ